MAETKKTKKATKKVVEQAVDTNLVDTVEKLEELINRVKEAQRIFATFPVGRKACGFNWLSDPV